MVNNYAWEFELGHAKTSCCSSRYHLPWLLSDLLQLIITVGIGLVRHLGTYLLISVNTLKALSLHMSYYVKTQLLSHQYLVFKTIDGAELFHR